jgi:sugar/nucleoside kinase (ribokinase family)
VHRPLIIGIATVDAVARTLDRFPEPGGLQLFDELAVATGGCAVSVAIALSRLGIGADLIARVGHDSNGDFLLAELERHGVGTALVRRDDARPTSFSFVAVHGNGERSFLHTTGGNGGLCAADVADEQIQDRHIVLVAGAMVMDGFDGEPCAEVLGAAHAHGAITMLDTVFVEGLDASEWRRRVRPALAHLDFFVPSLPEVRALSGRDSAEDAAVWCLDSGATRVVIKLGDRGVLCADSNGFTYVPPFRVARVVDATGAGDCWCAGFIAGLCEGRVTNECALLGNAVAAIGIGAPGATTAVPPLVDVRAFMESTPNVS